jgi:GT2 family glycosyltransferase
MAPESSMRLSVVIVSWNVRRDVSACLRSLQEHPARAESEIIVVDNASTDGTVESLRQSFPHVTVVANRENRGFAAANNQALAVAQGRHVLFLNPDTVVHPHALDTLVEFLDGHDDVGACSPQLRNEDGTIQPSLRRFPTFPGILHQSTIFRHTRLFCRQYDHYMMKDFDGRTQVDVDICMGAALMVRRSALDRIGTMDERFFMYYEEADLCYRLKQAGWRIVFVPDAVITHLGGQSSSQVPVAMRLMMLTSLLQYFRKHRGPLATGLFNCVFKPALIARELCDLLAGALTYVASLLLWDPVRRRKSALKVRSAAILLGKYSWWILFKA